MNNCLSAAALATTLAFGLPAAAHAAPGLAGEVYAATVDKGEFELEARYGRLGGGPDHGEDALKLEAGYGVTGNLRLAAVAEFEKEPGLPRKTEAVGFEAVYALGKVGPVNVAVYGEYEAVIDGTDAIETKLLLQHRSGAFDLRLNLIAAKPLADGAPVELGYAASADVAVLGEARFGLQAYGDLGTFRRFAPRAEHFVGPVARFEIEFLGPEELGVEIGYLTALGAARDDTDGMLRVRLELEF